MPIIEEDAVIDTDADGDAHKLGVALDNNNDGDTDTVANIVTVTDGAGVVSGGLCGNTGEFCVSDPEADIDMDTETSIGIDVDGGTKDLGALRDDGEGKIVGIKDGEGIDNKGALVTTLEGAITGVDDGEGEGDADKEITGDEGRLRVKGIFGFVSGLISRGLTSSERPEVSRRNAPREMQVARDG